MPKKVLAIFMIGICILMLFASSAYFVLTQKYKNPDFLDHIESTVERTITTAQKVTGFTFFNEIYGAFNVLASPYEAATSSGAVIKDQDGYLEPIDAIFFDTAIAAKNLYELSKVCEENGAAFTYVSYPSKTNRETTQKAEKYGISSNGEEIRQAFLSALHSCGLDILDVRTLLENDGYTTKDVFYKTDHHWKSTAGFYAARAITNHLNDTYHCSFRTDLLDEKLFNFTTHENIWFGETGRKYSVTWVNALDDFTEILPKYETSFKTGSSNGEYDNSGNFSTIFVDESGYTGSNNLYRYSAHYSYGSFFDAASPVWIHNNLVEGEKILVIKDSFNQVVIPFLALTTADVAVWDMRVSPEGLYDYIEANDFDAVIVAYTDFWRDDMYNFK